MKKDYMKPEGQVVALRMNENISASGKHHTTDNFGIYYTVKGDTRFIYTSGFEAAATGSDEANRLLDLVNIWLHDLPSTCKYDPDTPTV